LNICLIPNQQHICLQRRRGGPDQEAASAKDRSPLQLERDNEDQHNQRNSNKAEHAADEIVQSAEQGPQRGVR